MRYLVHFTLGFGAACFCRVYSDIIPGWLPLVMLLSALLTGIKLRVLVIAAGFFSGILWYGLYQTLWLSPVQALDGVTKQVSIRASDYSYDTDYGMVVDGAIVAEEKTYQVRAYLEPEEAIVPGHCLTGDFRFRLTTPDAKEETTHHSGKGIFLLAYQEGDLTRHLQESWRDIPAKLRFQIKEILRTYFPEDVYPFAKALLLGDASDLGYAVDTDLKVSGIRHVAAVSGLHVSILFALVSTLTLRRRFLTAILGYPALLLFAALAGFSPSVVRSCVMCGLMLLAMLLNREYDGPTALSFAVLTMLICNPLVITSVSLQLSVASVAGIYLFQGKILRYLRSQFPESKGRTLGRRLQSWFTVSVSVSLSAMSITTPLCAWYFGMVSLIGPVTNLLTLWVISAVFYGMLGVCALHVAFPVLAGLLANAAAWPIRYILWIAQKMSRLPLAAIYTKSAYVLFWLVFVYGLLLIFLFSRNKRPVFYGCCAVLGLCFCLMMSWLEPMTDDVRFTVLDVGQGQCLLFQSQGKTVLVDCGGDSNDAAADLAAETLLSQGISHLDVMILTHLDEDHAGGAQNLLSRVDVGLLVLPWTHTELDFSGAKQVLFAAENLELTVRDTAVRIYSPGFPGNGNEMSLCVLFDTEKCDILVTGDRSGFGERLLLKRNSIPQADILVAGHHGASDSTCEALLEAVNPEIVCISAGKDNLYGHPAPELLSRLSRYGCQVYRTDVRGTITIRR